MKLFNKQKHMKIFIYVLIFVLILSNSCNAQTETDNTAVTEVKKTGTEIDLGRDEGKLRTNYPKDLKQTVLDYPSTSLQCYSSFTKPDMRLICPAARSSYCVKETTTLKPDLCGHTKYFGDMYVDSICVLRKCAAECKEGLTFFEFNKEQYSRSTFCCETSFCNAGNRSNVISFGLSLALILILILLFI